MMTAEQFHKQWDVSQINSPGKYYWYNMAEGYAAAQLAEKEREIARLQTWKESQINVTPDWQVIGELLSIGLGQSVSENIIPAIKELRERLAESKRYGETEYRLELLLRKDLGDMNARAEAAEERLKEAQERPFCEGCDHGVTDGGLCELCEGMGYKERRNPPHLGKRLQEAQARIKELEGMNAVVQQISENCS